MSTRAEATAARGDVSQDVSVHGVLPPAPSKGFCSVRRGLALIFHICNFAISTQDRNLSIALPAMVNSSPLPCLPNVSAEAPPTGIQDTCNDTHLRPGAVGPVYDWSPDIQGVILSSFSYGSFLASVPSGYVAGIFRVKYLFGAALLTSSILNLLIPWATDAGVAFLIILRAIQGVAQVMMLTSQYSIWVKWAPPLERSQLITFTISGSVLGIFIVLLTGGFLCEALGWPSVFYVFGGVGCACVCLWLPLVHEDPDHHPFISAAERDYIVCSLAQQDCAPHQSLPIKAMITSLPLWSILVSHFTLYWYTHVILAYSPTYLHSVLAVDLKDSGVLSALMIGTIFICVILGGLLADLLLSRKMLTLLTTRRLFTATGVLLSSIFFGVLPWVRSSLGLTIAFLVLSVASGSLCQSGVLVNFIDIAPRYAGFLKGLSQVFSDLSGVIAPSLSGFLIRQDSESGWRNSFLLSVAVNIAGMVFFLIFSQGEVQDWAKDPTLTRL